VIGFVVLRLATAGELEVTRLRGCPYACERCGRPLPGLVVWPQYCLPYCLTAWDESVIRNRMSNAEIREETFARSERRGRNVGAARRRLRRYLWLPAIAS
jgi:hypothetical protein